MPTRRAGCSDGAAHSRRRGASTARGSVFLRRRREPGGGTIARDDVNAAERIIDLVRGVYVDRLEYERPARLRSRTELLLHAKAFIEENLSDPDLDDEIARACSISTRYPHRLFELERQNHRSDIERFAKEIAARSVKPELEIYSAVMIEEAAYLLSLGILEPPYALNSVLHTPTQGGARGTPRNLIDMWKRLDELPVPRSELP